MTSLTLAAVLQASLLATGNETYAEAHRQNQQTGQPIVVMVGADWCPACVMMKNSVINQVRQRGILRKVAFAMVNLDREQQLGQQLTAGGPIPQLIVYRQTEAGWKCQKLIGGQTVETVESFISSAVQATDTKRPAQTPQPAPQATPASPDSNTAYRATPGTNG